MTKPDTEWKSCEGQSQIKAKDQKSQSQSQLNKLTVKTKAVIEDTIGCNLNHSDDGPVKASNSLLYEAVKTKWALRSMTTSHFVVQLTETMKTLKNPILSPY
ncbi:hypothetical protein Tco_1123183 [Tanacetum coccineum]|uniref:Uncharacterized protein n=1 Tax=Tanacetum coccineum TaxID=301880 RepID=A0ABQ5J5K0_9ASTR